MSDKNKIILEFLEEEFPWLAIDEDMELSGADVIDQLQELYETRWTSHKR